MTLALSLSVVPPYRAPRPSRGMPFGRSGISARRAAGSTHAAVRLLAYPDKWALLRPLRGPRTADDRHDRCAARSHGRLHRHRAEGGARLGTRVAVRCRDA